MSTCPSPCTRKMNYCFLTHFSLDHHPKFITDATNLGANGKITYKETLFPKWSFCVRTVPLFLFNVDTLKCEILSTLIWLVAGGVEEGERGLIILTIFVAVNFSTLFTIITCSAPFVKSCIWLLRASDRITEGYWVWLPSGAQFSSLFRNSL